jgi:asparagine synthase (glutamine-hydrolysing)
LLAADVRLDDRGGLTAALGIPRERARLLADSALVMAAVERWEEDAIRRLYGDFAIALWDAAQSRLLLARDMLGQRPLHYHRGKRFFAFASMPSGLHALAEVPRAPDEEAMARFLAWLPATPRSTFFQDVEKVQPGEMQIVSRHGTKAIHHWSFSGQELRLAKTGDYVEAAREALDAAVETRLRGASDKVAAHLSGGLDSGAVAATAARLIGPAGKVTAFTSVPGPTGFDRRGRFADESGHAAAVAAMYPNMEHVLVRSDDRSPIAALDRNFDLYQAPVFNLCSYAWGEAISDEAHRRGHKVLLTGQLGNFTLSHPGMELLPDLLRRGRLPSLVREARALRARGFAWESVIGRTLQPFLPGGVWQVANRLRGRRLTVAEVSALAPGLRAGLRTGERIWRLDLRRPLAARIRALQESDFGTFRHGALAAWGIDVRDPTGDRRLIELCLSIPVEQYLANGVPRALARRVLADRLPAQVIGEMRKGFQGADWYVGLVADWKQVEGEMAAIAAAPAARRLLDVPRLQRLADAPRERDWDSDETQAAYRFALLRGLSAGHFLRRASGAPDLPAAERQPRDVDNRDQGVSR